MHLISDLIEKLELLPHPEGGYYKETYRSKRMVAWENLPDGFSGSRNFSTAIYYLLPAGNFSAFHAISSDECWHFYEGLPLNIYVLQANGHLEIIKLGKDIAGGEVYQAVVPANCWFASRPSGTEGFSLTGCTVSPGFDFADFRMANRAELLEQYPQHEKIILELTR